MSIEVEARVETPLKVGQVAARTGLTVRTLHHYDEIGLLTPSERTRAGHRLYGPNELLRLQQIASLRHVGLSLPEIKAALDRPGATLTWVLERQLERIDSEIERHRELRQLVTSLAEKVRASDAISIGELTGTIHATLLQGRYFTAEQRDRLGERAAEVGPERMRAAERAWQEIFAGFAEAVDEGLAVDAPRVQELARRARTLIDAFTGGDASLQRSLGEMYEREGPDAVLSPHGIELRPGVWQFMQEATAALDGE